MTNLLATSSGASLVALGHANLKTGILLETTMGHQGDEPSCEGDIARIVGAIAEVDQFESELTAKRSENRRHLWSFSTRGCVCIGNISNYPNVSFVVFEFDEDGDWDTPEIRNLARIGLAHLRAIAAMPGNGPSVSIPPSISESVLKCLSFGYIVVDANGMVRSFKDSADRWLERNGAFRIHGGRLISAAHKDRQLLKAAIEAASDDRRKVSVLIPESDETLATGTVYVMPIEGSDNLALIVFGQGRSDRAVRELALKAMGLTAAERRLTQNLMEGTTLADAANEANLTISTARSYLKSIFAKTGMRRQSQLVTLCLNLTPAIKASGPKQGIPASRRPQTSSVMDAVK